MEKQKQGVLHKLNDTHEVNFSTTDDLFVFIAATGSYERLAEVYEERGYGRLDTATYRFYKAKHQRYIEIITTTKLTDGKTFLLDFVKGKLYL